MESVTEILSTESSLTSFAGRRGAGGNGDGQDSLLCSLSTAGEGRGGNCLQVSGRWYQCNSKNNKSRDRINPLHMSI